VTDSWRGHIDISCVRRDRTGKRIPIRPEESFDFLIGDTRCVPGGVYPASPAELTRRDKIVRLYIMKIAHENNNDDAAVAS